MIHRARVYRWTEIRTPSSASSTGFPFYTRTSAHFLVPLAIDPTSRFHRGQNALAFGLLKPSSTIVGAQAELRSHIPRMRDAFAFAALTTAVTSSCVLARTLRGLVYDVSTSDPLTYVTVALGILAVAVLASWIPAQRASRADPSLAMRRD